MNIDPLQTKNIAVNSREKIDESKNNEIQLNTSNFEGKLNNKNNQFIFIDNENQVIENRINKTHEFQIQNNLKRENSWYSPNIIIVEKEESSEFNFRESEILDKYIDKNLNTPLENRKSIKSEDLKENKIKENNLSYNNLEKMNNINEKNFLIDLKSNISKYPNLPTKNKEEAVNLIEMKDYSKKNFEGVNKIEDNILIYDNEDEVCENTKPYNINKSKYIVRMKERKKNKENVFLNSEIDTILEEKDNLIMNKQSDIKNENEQNSVLKKKTFLRNNSDENMNNNCTLEKYFLKNNDKDLPTTNLPISHLSVSNRNKNLVKIEINKLEDITYFNHLIPINNDLNLNNNNNILISHDTDNDNFYQEELNTKTQDINHNENRNFDMNNLILNAVININEIDNLTNNSNCDIIRDFNFISLKKEIDDKNFNNKKNIDFYNSGIINSKYFYSDNLKKFNNKEFQMRDDLRKEDYVDVDNYEKLDITSNLILLKKDGDKQINEEKNNIEDQFEFHLIDQFNTNNNIDYKNMYNAYDNKEKVENQTISENRNNVETFSEKNQEKIQIKKKINNDKTKNFGINKSYMEDFGSVKNRDENIDDIYQMSKTLSNRYINKAIYNENDIMKKENFIMNKTNDFKDFRLKDNINNCDIKK